MEVIECRALRKVYRRTVAVEGLDLAVGPGEVFGFLGPNGAGKTTTLRMLLGLVRPSSGTVTVLARPAGDRAALAQIGALVEEPAAYPWLTGRANLQVVADTGPAVSKSQIADALDRAGATSFADRKVATYSQGMRQRLGLAAALLRRPKLLLLDEPTNGLDPQGIKDFRTVVRSVADDGMTVVLSSHLLSEVEQVCDRVVVLGKGKMLADSRTAQLVDHRTFRVDIDSTQLEIARSALAGFTVSEAGPSALQVDAASGRDVAEALASAGVFPESLIPQRPSLESWYLSLTSETPGEGRAEKHEPAAS